MSSKLYFIALIPPEPIFTELEKFKHILADKYNSSHSLKTPPHITIYKPFKFEEEREEDLAIALEDFAASHLSIKMEVNGFGCFAPSVIYVRPLENDILNNLFDYLLKSLELDLEIFDPGYSNRSFNPHMTIAHRDLDKNVFPLACKEFKNLKYNRTFSFEKIFLLKHNGHSWDINDEFNFIL